MINVIVFKRAPCRRRGICSRYSFKGLPANWVWETSLATFPTKKWVFLKLFIGRRYRRLKIVQLILILRFTVLCFIELWMAVALKILCGHIIRIQQGHLMIHIRSRAGCWAHITGVQDRLEVYKIHGAIRKSCNNLKSFSYCVFQLRQKKIQRTVREDLLKLKQPPETKGS